MAKISTKQIAEAIYATTKNKSGVELERALANAVQFLAKKNLLSKAPEILSRMEHISDTDHGITRARVSSKSPLTKKVTEKIESMLKKRYKAKEAVLDFKEDNTLIGGMRIETEEEVIDLSLKDKLNQLQNYLLTH